MNNKLNCRVLVERYAQAFIFETRNLNFESLSSQIGHSVAIDSYTIGETFHRKKLLSLQVQ